MNMHDHGIASTLPCANWLTATCMFTALRELVAVVMGTSCLPSNPALRARLAFSARRLVEARYDWEQIGQRFVALVEEV